MRALTPRRGFAALCFAVANARRHACFVRALACRRIALLVRPVAQVLRATARLTWHTTRLTAPRVWRETRVERATPTGLRSREVTHRVHDRNREHTHTLLVRLIERRTRLERHHRSHALRRGVERVVTSAIRAPAVTRASVVQRIERVAAFPRIAQMTLRTQPVVATSRETLPPVTAPGRSAAPRTHEPIAARAAAVVLPLEELSRVSNFVIAELDRRVLSCRERTGRL